MNKLKLLVILIIGCTSVFSGEANYFQAALQKFEAEEYREALQLLDRHAKQHDANDPKLLVFLAQTHYKLNEHPAAVQALENGIATAKAKGSPVKKHWWELMRYLYWQEGQYEEAIRTIQEMDATYPDPYVKAKIEKLEHLISLRGATSQLARSDSL